MEGGLVPSIYNKDVEICSVIVLMVAGYRLGSQYIRMALPVFGTNICRSISRPVRRPRRKITLRHCGGENILPFSMTGSGLRNIDTGDKIVLKLRHSPPMLMLFRCR